MNPLKKPHINSKLDTKQPKLSSESIEHKGIFLKGKINNRIVKI